MKMIKPEICKYCPNFYSTLCHKCRTYTGNPQSPDFNAGTPNNGVQQNWRNYEKQMQIAAAKVYISGSITKDPDYRAHFRAAEEKLRGMGMKVFNPAKFEADPNKTWEDYMRKDIAELMTCRAIYLLKGWKKSRGARIEYRIAKELGYMVIFE